MLTRRCRPWLGTLVEVEAECVTAIEAGFAAIERVHTLMSAHQPMSEISRLNRGERVEISPDTCAVLDRALFWFAASDGIFDPVVAGRSAIERGALPLHPGQALPERSSDLRLLRMEGSMAWLERPAYLDLGGIAKGHAVDAAVRAMRMAGARSGLVNAGGDLAVFGQPRGIEVVDPSTRAPLLHVRLEDRALATSAGVRNDKGLSFVHLPRRCSRLASVTVESAHAIDADALTKIVLAGHPRLSGLLAAADARALAIANTGDIFDMCADRLAA
ncbi:MAG: FAD:protein FMN transferase [Sphingomicrobium sp.]